MFRPRIEKKFMIRLLRNHKDFSEEWIAEINSEPQAALENSLTHLAKKMANRVREVQKEYHRQRSFLRINTVDEDVISAQVECHHNTEMMILKHLHQRFPGKIIILNSKLKRKTFKFDGKCFIETDMGSKQDQGHDSEIARKLKLESDLKSDLESDQRLVKSAAEAFQVYYESQYIDSRYNPRYFRHFIPKKNFKSSNLAVEQRAFNKSLDDFCKPNTL